MRRWWPACNSRRRPRAPAPRRRREGGGLRGRPHAGRVEEGAGAVRLPAEGGCYFAVAACLLWAGGGASRGSLGVMCNAARSYISLRHVDASELGAHTSFPPPVADAPALMIQAASAHIIHLGGVRAPNPSLGLLLLRLLEFQCAAAETVKEHGNESHVADGMLHQILLGWVNPCCGDGRTTSKASRPWHERLS